VSLLLPQTRGGVVRSATPVSIHGDRYVESRSRWTTRRARRSPGASARTTAAGLATGERVSARFMMA